MAPVSQNYSCYRLNGDVLRRRLRHRCYSVTRRGRNVILFVFIVRHFALKLLSERCTPPPPGIRLLPIHAYEDLLVKNRRDRIIYNYANNHFSYAL